MKRIVSLCLVLALIFSLTGCKGVRKLYNYDLSKYVTLGNYAVEVDTSSDEYKNYLGEFDEQFADVLRKEVTEGTVENGDTVNIDYTGKLDGKAFDGGTDTDYDLKIGSGTFIKGFEESLIGAKIGSTVDINVTFPSDYGVESLNGKDAVFTVKLNSKVELNAVTTGNVKNLGYDTLEAYSKAKKEYAVSNVAWDKIYEEAKILEYPEKETDIIFEETVQFLEQACKQNNMTLADFIEYNGMTEASFNEYLMEYDVKYSVYRDLICYSILDAENYELTEADLAAGEKELKESDGNEGITHTKGMIEERAAYLAAKTIILNKAIIK